MKRRITQLFRIIRNAEAELKRIRDACKHPKTYEGNWSDRPGQIIHANICSDCGWFISATGKMPEGFGPPTSFTIGDALNALDEQFPGRLFKSSDERFDT